MTSISSDDRHRAGRSTQDHELLQDAGPFRTLFERSPEGMMLVDPHDPSVVAPIIACNESAAAMNGYTRDELLGRPVSILTRDPESHEELATFVERLRVEGVIAEEDVHYRKDGSAFHIEYSTVLITIGDREFMLGIDRDITHRKMLEEALAHQATHDFLTGLPNRAFLRNRLLEALAGQNRVAVLFIDLDGFKEVNDTFGHHVGDELLRAVASRFAGSIRSGDVVCRLGGDEFAIVLEHADESVTQEIAHGLAASLREPFIIDSQPLRTSASVGSAFYPKGCDDVTTLMRQADIAMYAAKALGVSYTAFSRRLEHQYGSRRRMATPVESAAAG